MHRRTFLKASAAAASIAATAASIDPAYHLIAHRGGVVDDQHPENSPGSLQAAIDRGYWMIEVDIRRTKDGEPILQHDGTFGRFYGVDRAVEDMTWAQVSKLRSEPGGTSPIHFREVCRMCQGKVGLMLDIKGDGFPREFYEHLRSLLASHKLLQTAYLLGGGSGGGAHLAPHCLRSVNRTTLKEAIARGEDVKSHCFLFELASELSEESWELCQRTGVTAVAAINTFRYTLAKRDEWKGPEEDAARLKKLGVRHFQIDSRYDPLFTRQPSRKG